MPLDYDQLHGILERESKTKSTAEEESSYPANVLLQIVLPIVLILAFLILIRMQMLEKKARDLETIKTKFLSEERGKTLDNYRKSEMELQRQRLLVALEKVKAERRIYYGIGTNLLNNIEIQKGKLYDQNFKITCERTFADLGNAKSQTEQEKYIYKAVLDSALIKDPGYNEFEGSWQIVKKPDVITNENRIYLRKQIRSFIVRLIERAKIMQYESIYRIFEFYLFNENELNNLVPDLRKYRDDINKARTDEEKLIYTQRLHNRLINNLAAKLKDEGYKFFEETWQNIRKTS